MAQTTDTVFRSVVKTIFFKVVTTGTTTLFMGLGDAILLHCILTAFYLLYERVWNKIKWGRVSKNTEPKAVKRKKVIYQHV